MNSLHKRRLVVGLAAAVAVGGLVSACGVKGPLYLPEEDEKDKEKDEDKEKISRRSPAPHTVRHA